MQEEGGAEKCSIPFNENTPIGGDYISPAISNENTGTRYADILKSIMNKDIGSVENNYDRADSTRTTRWIYRSWNRRGKPILENIAVCFPRCKIYY